MRLLLAALAAAFAIPPVASHAAGQYADSSVFDVVALAPGVYVADVRPRPPAYAFANSLVVVGARGVLVVDTQQSPTAARSLIAQIRTLTDLPVRWVVNTHWHADHVAGNVAYRAAFPDAEFVAHATLAADLKARGEPWMRQQIQELPATIEERRRWLRDGRGADGKALSEADGEAVRYSLRLREAYLDELRGLELVAPTLTFEKELHLDLGGRSVRLLHLGPAHTRGDVVVLLPAERIIAVGDLLEHGEPWIDDDTDVAGWARALDTVAALGASVYVPSHGPPVRDDALLDRFRAHFRSLVKDARAAGRP